MIREGVGAPDAGVSINNPLTLNALSKMLDTEKTEIKDINSLGILTS